MSRELVIVRHGQCTGNVADRASSKGDHSFFTKDLRKNKSNEWPLTELGIIESKLCGIWIRENIAKSFDYYLSSDYVRAIETARHMNFNSACWQKNLLLRERNWGGVENLPYPERSKIFSKLGIPETENSIHWRPPNGESLSSVIRKMHRFLTELHERNTDGRALVISHGAPIQAIRVIQNGISDNDYLEFISGNNYIRNCQIFHYFGSKNGSGPSSYSFERSAYLTPDGSWVESIRELE